MPPPLTPTKLQRFWYLTQRLLPTDWLHCDLRKRLDPNFGQLQFCYVGMNLWWRSLRGSMKKTSLVRLFSKRHKQLDQDPLLVTDSLFRLTKMSFWKCTGSCLQKGHSWCTFQKGPFHFTWGPMEVLRAFRWMDARLWQGDGDKGGTNVFFKQRISRYAIQNTPGCTSKKGPRGWSGGFWRTRRTELGWGEGKGKREEPIVGRGGLWAAKPANGKSETNELKELIVKYENSSWRKIIENSFC